MFEKEKIKGKYKKNIIKTLNGIIRYTWGRANKKDLFFHQQTKNILIFYAKKEKNASGLHSLYFF